MSYLLSILVPTKNRYCYLKELISLITSFNSSDIELVIQDNSDDNSEFLKYIEENDSAWIKYFYCGNSLTSVENFDKSVLNSTGEYLCFIGDDDGVVRNIIDFVKWMKINDVEALRGLRSDYYWMETGKHGGLLYHEKISNKIETLNSVKELTYMLRQGCQDLCKLPLLYTGIVRRDTLDKIYNIGGTYFPGASGDIVNGVALSFILKKYVYIKTPIVISGTSANTGGGVYKVKKRRLNLSEVGFISKKTVEEWEESIPPIWSGVLVWPESAIKALKYMSQESYIEKVNFNLLLANFAFRNKSYFALAFKYAKSKIIFGYYFLYKVMRYLFVGITDKIIRYTSNNTKCLNGNIQYGVKDISEAESILYDKIKTLNVRDLYVGDL